MYNIKGQQDIMRSPNNNLNNEPMLIDVGHGLENQMDDDATLSDINENSKGL
jgi:hypothetical protein